MGLLGNFSLMTLVSYSATTWCSCTEALSLPHITCDTPVCPEPSAILQWEQSPSLSGTSDDLSLSLSRSGGPAVLCATEGAVTPPSVPFITVTRCCFLWVLSTHFHTYGPWPFRSGLVVPRLLRSEMEAAMTASARLWLSSWLEHLPACRRSTGIPPPNKVHTRWMSNEVSATEQVFYRFCGITLDLH